MKKHCRCGNIEIEWDTSIKDLTARLCSCEYCTNMGAEYVSDASSAVKFKINNESNHRVVNHGTSTADFHECTNCGLALVTAQIESYSYAVLNSKVLGISIGAVNFIPNDFSGESVTERSSRRKNNWCRVYPAHNKAHKADAK